MPIPVATGRRKRAGLVVLSLLFAFPLVTPPASAEPVEYLATSHWAYHDLEALWTRGVVDSLNMLVRPWSRMEIAHRLIEARERDAAVMGDPIFERLWRQFGRELAWLGEDTREQTLPLIRIREGDPAEIPAGEPSRAKDVRFLVGVDGVAGGSPPSKMQILPGAGGVVAAKAYFWPDFYVGTEIWAERTGTDRNIGDALVKNEDFYLAARESYVTLAPHYFEFLFGLTETRWGPGRHGSLLLSDVARPYMTLRWNASVAGRLDFTAVHGNLVQSDNRYFAAHRLTFHAAQGLSIGLSETARYDSQSPDWLYVVNLIPYTLVERYIAQNREGTPGISTRNNVIIGLDGVWRLTRGLSLYGEFLADEITTERANIPNRLGWQLGASVSRVVAGSPSEATFEYTKVFRYTYSVFYDRDFILAGDPLGFVGGPDTEHYTLRLKVDPSRDLSAIFDLGVFRRGEGYLGESWDPADPADPWSGLNLTGVVETTTRAFATVAWTPRDNARAEVGIGMRNVQNVDHQDGKNATDPEAIVRLFLRK